MHNRLQIRTILIGIILLFTLWGASNVMHAASSNKLYLTNSSDKILRTELDGTNSAVVVSGVAIDVDTEIDAAAGKIYFLSGPYCPTQIRRANLDGSNVEVVVANICVSQGIALDTTNGKLYWSSQALIERANLDGTNRETFVSNQQNARKIEVAGGKLYWTDDGQRVSRFNLDGSGVIEVINTSAGQRGLAVDASTGHVYFKDNAGNLARMNLDGTGVITLISDVGDIAEIELNIDGGKVYYALYGSTNQVRRANLDGTNPEILNVGPVSSEPGLAIGPVPPTPTPTNTSTATPTGTPTATSTNTPILPTATATSTAIPPTATSTNTPILPTATATNTAIPPTLTATPLANCPLAVINVNDSGAGSLRQAIANASAACRQIGFAAGLSGQTIRLAAPLVIAKDVTIDGSGRKITISGDTDNNGSGDVAVFTMNAGTVTLSHLTVTKGFGADGLGGGISISQGARVLILQSTIRDNISDNGSTFSAGGGIYNTGVLTLTNSTVSNNQAVNAFGLGGGIHSSFGSVTTIRYSTITNNRAPTDGVGGGINVEGGTVTLVGSIVSGNSAPTGPAISVNNSGTLVVNGYNVIGANHSAGMDGATPGTTDIVPAGDVNTLINTTLADTGGDSATHAIVAGGPAYNAIPANIQGCGTTITVDQRGATRPVGAGCDVGAVESGTLPSPTPTATNTLIPPTATATNTPVAPTATSTNTPIPLTATPTNTSIAPTATATNISLPPTTTPTATNTPLSPTATPTQSITQRDCTQDALVAAINAGGSGTVTLDGTCRYLLTRVDSNSASNGASSELISKASAIEGNGATLERAPNAPQFRLLSLSKVGIVVRNLTLRAGNSVLDGGALFASQDIVLENVRIENSSAAGKGGGLYAVGNVTLRNSTLNNNQAGSDGGGAYITRYSNTTTTGLIEKSILTGNRAGGNGGGLYHYGQTLQINNSIFAHNKATQVNGGAQLHKAEQGSNLTVMQSTFSDSVQNSNPALFVWSTLNLQNSIVANHTIGVGTAGGPLYAVVEDYNLFAGNGQDVIVLYNGGSLTRGSHSFIALDPRFVDVTNNNYRLTATSPAINAGTSGGPALDADGQPRPSAGTPDIGAYEFQGQPIAALQIAKEAPPWVIRDRASRYALTVFNAGKVAAQSLQIVEQLPIGATYVANSASDGGVYNNGVLTWSIGNLAPGASKRVEYRAMANQTLVSDHYRVVSSVDSNVQESGKAITTPLNQKIVASIDFQPNPDGFAFPNYGDSPQSDLTADDMAYIFGTNKVCKSQNPCVLTAAAEAWRQAWVLNVEGGHCAGMAMGSLDIFANPNVAPVNFLAGANVTFDLTKPSVRRFIALYATTQTKYPTTWATLQNQGLAWVPASTPATVLDTLIANFNNPNAPDRYRLSISRAPAAGGGNGHTIVPYAIEQRTSDEYLIYIYENNAPNDYTRAILVNRTANTWSYVGTTAPGQPLYNYYGSAADNNIDLVSWRWATTFPKVCDSACTSPVVDQVRSASPNISANELIEFQLDGEGYLLVTRNDGKRVGFDPTTGAWINEIVGAERIEFNTGLGLNQPPLLQIPQAAGATYQVQVSNRTTAFGNLNATANVNIFGTNFAVRLTGLQLNSPELTPVDLGNGVQTAAVQAGPFDEVSVGFDPTHNRLTYQASGSDGDTPAVSLAVNNPDGSDYSFTLDNLKLQSEHSLALAFDQTSGVLTLENNDSNNAVYSVVVERVNQDGTTNRYRNDNVTDGDGVGTRLNVGNDWDGTNPPALQENHTSTLPGLTSLYLPIIQR